MEEEEEEEEKDEKKMVWARYPLFCCTHLGNQEGVQQGKGNS